MSEGIVELTVQVTPEHVLQGLANRSAGADRLSEGGFGVGNIERQDDGRSADGRRSEHTHLRELVRDVEQRVADAEANRHAAAVRRGDAADLLRSEGLPVEGSGPVGSLDDDVWCECHGAIVRHAVEQVPSFLGHRAYVRAARAFRSARISRAAFAPGPPVTPPPGWAPEPQR